MTHPDLAEPNQTGNLKTRHFNRPLLLVLGSSLGNLPGSHHDSIPAHFSPSAILWRIVQGLTAMQKVETTMKCKARIHSLLVDLYHDLSKLGFVSQEARLWLPYQGYIVRSSTLPMDFSDRQLPQGQNQIHTIQFKLNLHP